MKFNPERPYYYKHINVIEKSTSQMLRFISNYVLELPNNILNNFSRRESQTYSHRGGLRLMVWHLTDSRYYPGFCLKGPRKTIKPSEIYLLDTRLE
jgi:hypothetical protein